MNTQTGQLITPQQYAALTGAARAGFVAVTRDLSAKESADMQIRKYAPCGCGSGKKFKFCCWKPGGTA